METNILAPTYTASGIMLLFHDIGTKILIMKPRFQKKYEATSSRESSSQ